jgi:DNA-binding transcriptional regulator YiaG
MPIDFDARVVYHPVVSGDEIRRIREARGWSKADFARVLGASWVSVNNWEMDKARPSPVYARMIREIEQVLPTKSE